MEKFVDHPAFFRQYYIEYLQSESHCFLWELQNSHITDTCLATDCCTHSPMLFQCSLVTLNTPRNTPPVNIKRNVYNQR